MSDILISESAGVRTITLNRPERRNALTVQMQVDLIHAFRQADDSPTTRVVVLTGAGDAFCAGLDLTSLQKMQDKSALELSEDAHRLQKLFRTLYELPVPTIAAVNGPAVAGGTGLATLCDFTLAIPAARFGYSEVKIGFVPAIVSAYLSLQVGEKRARELLLTGRLFTAAEGVEYGLVTEMVQAEDLQTRVASLTEMLKANSPLSMRATKNLLTDQNRAWLDAAMHVSMQANARSRETPDFREGIAAFLEKRKPSWAQRS